MSGESLDTYGCINELLAKVKELNTIMNKDKPVRRASSCNKELVDYNTKPYNALNKEKISSPMNTHFFSANVTLKTTNLSKIIFMWYNFNVKCLSMTNL